MKQLYEIRKSYGGVYVTAFDDGFLVPWKPLSIGDFLKYSQDRQRGIIPVVCLEDEIFLKCVQDESILRQMPFLKAGIVTTVVINIWQFSGPSGIEEFTNDLNTARYLLDSPDVRILHELVQLISIAFPYKPEEIYEMDYQKFLFRVAQSEKKLLQMGIFLKEPITVQTEIKKPKKSKLGTIEQPRPSLDAKKLWDEQHTPQTDTPKKVSMEDVKMTGDKWWSKSPVLEAPNKHNIDFKTEAAEQHTFGLSGHEKADIHIETAKMIEDAKWIYKDLLSDLAKRKKR
jgi:hypothetical protein